MFNYFLCGTDSKFDLEIQLKKVKSVLDCHLFFLTFELTDMLLIKYKNINENYYI